MAWSTPTLAVLAGGRGAKLGGPGVCDVCDSPLGARTSRVIAARVALRHAAGAGSLGRSVSQAGRRCAEAHLQHPEAAPGEAREDLGRGLAPEEPARAAAGVASHHVL